MIVLKFGGTSVSTKESVLTLCNIVEKNKNLSPIVVVSALKDVTNSLLYLTENKKDQESSLSKIKSIHIDLVNQVWEKQNKNHIIEQIIAYVSEIRELLNDNQTFTPKSVDKVLAFGEIISSYIIAEALKLHNIKSQQILATTLIVTNSSYGSAEYLEKPTEKKIKKVLIPLINNAVVPVITGFLGATKNGDTTTLGRGGSDYSASIIGSCLGVDEIQIWTDVDGVLTADPKVVIGAKTLKEISYKTAETLATYGAKVLHPKTMKPAIKKKILIRVLNTFNPKSQGTRIVHKVENANENLLGISIQKISNNKSQIALVGKPLSFDKVYQYLQAYKDVIKNYEQGKYKLSFLIESNNPEEIVEELHENFIR